MVVEIVYIHSRWGTARVKLEAKAVHSFEVGGLSFDVLEVVDPHEESKRVMKYQLSHEGASLAPLGDELPLDGMDEIDLDDFLAKARKPGGGLSGMIKAHKARMAEVPELFLDLD